jgi:hypothetical protein
MDFSIGDCLKAAQLWDAYLKTRYRGSFPEWLDGVITLSRNRSARVWKTMPADPFWAQLPERLARAKALLDGSP